MKRITIEEGPLAGKAYDVPDDATVLDIPVKGGRYTVGPKHAPWHPDEEPVAPKPRASKARVVKPKPGTVDLRTPDEREADEQADAGRVAMGLPPVHSTFPAPTADTTE